MVLEFLENLEYSNDGMQRYVIVRGQVFRWEEKEPFVKSGKSVRGAMEYDPETGLVKCHECGQWLKAIGRHAAAAHGIKASQYKSTHGLRQRAGACSPELSAKHRDRAFARKATPISQDVRGSGWKARPSRSASWEEYRNAAAICNAQLLNRIRKIASDLGSAPPSRFDVQLSSAARRRFGSWQKACEAAGVEFNKSNQPHLISILRELLLDFYVLNRRMPKDADWGTGSLPKKSVYRTAFGSLRAAYDAAGLGLVTPGQSIATAINQAIAWAAGEDIGARQSASA